MDGIGEWDILTLKAQNILEGISNASGGTVEVFQSPFKSYTQIGRVPNT